MSNALELLDWRRAVHALYAEVRRVRAVDPAAAHARWRARRDELLADHPQSPLPPEQRPSFEGVPYFPYDPGFAFEAHLDTDVPTSVWELPSSDGTPMGATRVAVASTPLGPLDCYWLDGYAGGLFVPLRDLTSGPETYGGGRYVLDTCKGADLGSTPAGLLVLDLNFAYHPSCHYDARWACPLAPPGSRLEQAVRAGERSL